MIPNIYIILQTNLIARAFYCFIASFSFHKRDNPICAICQDDGSLFRFCRYQFTFCFLQTSAKVTVIMSYISNFKMERKRVSIYLV